MKSLLFIFAAYSSYLVSAASINELAECLLSPFEESGSIKKSCENTAKEFSVDVGAVAEYVKVQMRAQQIPELKSLNLSKFGTVYLNNADINTCFPNYDKDVKVKHQVVDQVLQSSYFLADLFVALGGDRTGSIFIPKSISICSEKAFQKKVLVWDQATQNLEINVPFKILNKILSPEKYPVLERKLIRELWSKGEHLPKSPARFQIGKKPGLADIITEAPRTLWPLLDPLGLFKSSLKQFLSKESKDLLSSLAGLKADSFKKFLTSKISEASKFNQDVSATMKAQGVEESPLPSSSSLQKRALSSEGMSALIAKITSSNLNNLSESDSLDLKKRLETKLAEPVVLAKAISGLFSFFQPCTISSNTQQTKILTGFVVVENSHNIQVCVATPQGSNSVTNNENRKIVASGFVVVSTSDNVQVAAGDALKLIFNWLEKSQTLLVEALAEVI